MICLLNDDALAAYMGANVRRLAETTFSWSEIAQEVETVYRRVLGRRGVARPEGSGNAFSSADGHATNQGLS